MTQATLATFLLLAAVLAGCASIPAEDEALLSGEIDCDQAEETMAKIRAARPTQVDRARILAMSLSPGGLLLGFATNDIRNRERLMSGAYDDELNARLGEIAAACGLAAPQID